MPPSEAFAGGALTFARVRGIPIRAHWTLALGLPFFAWLMAVQYFGTSPEGWAWGALLALVLFASVTAHELAHSFLAMRLGTRVREIILLPIGGASVMATPLREPRAEAAVSAVGPLASLLLGGAFLGGASLAGVPLTTPASVPPPQGFALAAGYLNLMLGFFNLLVPAFPMDGGRLLRALLARRLGFAPATRVAATIGRGLAVAMGLVGLFGGGLLLVVIALFVWGGATAEEQAATVAATLDGLSLGDVMTPRPASVAPEASVDEALHLMLESKHVLLPVVEDGRPVGLLRSDDVAAVPPAARRDTRVAEVARGDVPRMPPTEPASSLLERIGELGLVAVVDASDRLLGIVTPTDLVRTIQVLRATGRPGAA